MTYVTPVTDRVLSDVLNRTAKGYFNIADWSRIYNNSAHINDMAELATGGTIAFTTLTTPSVTTIPTPASINSLIENIDNVRAAVDYSTVNALTALKHDWAADAPTFDWKTVNDWERYISAIYNALVAAQTEVITNGSFTDGAWPGGDPSDWWDFGLEWFLEDGTLAAGGVTSEHLNYLQYTPVVGKVYKITFTIDSITGSVKLHCGADGANRTAPGTYTEYVTAADTQLYFKSGTGGTFDGYIDNVSVIRML